jgi:uncharacterized protein YjbI with pentapeptide repeats
MDNFDAQINDYADKRFAGLALQRQDFTGKEFEACEFKSCDLNEAVLSKAKFLDCRFIECNLSLAKVDQCKFRDVEFHDCKLLGINWTRASWPRLALSSPLKFHKCNLSDANFFGLNLEEVIIEDCKARDVDFREANLRGAVCSHTDFANSLFGRTNLAGADFTEAVNYDIDVFNNEIKKAKFTRYEALRLLDSLEIELVD